jgi:hypothetical protein
MAAQRILVGRRSASQVSLDFECISQMDVRIDPIGNYAQGLPKTVDGPANASLFDKGDAEIVVCGRMIRIDS